MKCSVHSIAKIFAREGANVTVSDLNQSSCYHVVKKLRKSNNHLAIEVDVTKKESLLNAVETLIKQFGKPPDIVVNSAGIRKKTPGKNMVPVPLLEMDEEVFDEVINVNLRGTFLVNQITADAMKEFNIHGAIVNISSIAGT